MVFSRLYQNDNELVRSNLLLLRMSLLVVTMITLVGLHLITSPIPHLSMVSIMLVATFAWTCMQFWQDLKRSEESPPIKNRMISLSLEILVDYFWVSVFVLLVGRSSNPFIYYLLVLVAIAAMVLPSLVAWCFCGAGIAIYSAFMALDMGQHIQHVSDNYRLHLFGMWINFVGSSLVSCYFISRLKSWGQHQQAQLIREREANLKNEQLIGIGTVAASTMHALATPLSTLTILVDDLRQNMDASSAAEDLELMHAQISRCRTTMKDLAHIASKNQAPQSTALSILLESLTEHFALQNPDAYLRLSIAEQARDARLLADPLLNHALINLVNNALESGSDDCEVYFDQDQKSVFIRIENTTTSGAEELQYRWGKAAYSNKSTGVGIGSLLANSTIERLGGEVSLTTYATTKSGQLRVLVTVQLPRDIRAAVND